MALTGRRQEIADALSTVAGVTGYPHRPTSLRPGDGWPLLGSLDRADGHSFEVTWRVLVVLPQEPRAASDWADNNYELLFDALTPIGFVDRIEPVALPASGTEQYALQITMRGE